MAAYVELYMDQGTTWTNVINLTDDTTGAYVNAAGYSVSSQMRRSYYSANATANITCEVTDDATGEITLSLTADETANIKAGRYLFDVETTDTGDTVTRILEGIITVTPGVTR
jgi:phage tail sheath gpL-like